MSSYLDDVGLALAVAASEHSVDGGRKPQVVRDAVSWTRLSGAGVHLPEELTWGSGSAVRALPGEHYTYRIHTSLHSPLKTRMEPFLRTVRPLIG